MNTELEIEKIRKEEVDAGVLMGAQRIKEIERELLIQKIEELELRIIKLENK